MQPSAAPDALPVRGLNMNSDDQTCSTSSPLPQAAASGKPIDMENFFSRLGLDIIGRAVFNYEFNSLRNDDPVIKVWTVV